RRSRRPPRPRVLARHAGAARGGGGDGHLPVPPGATAARGSGVTPVKPSVTLAQTTTSDGATLSLRMHDGQYHMRVGGHALMSTTATSSEVRLAELGCVRLVKEGRKHVLIGGLGFGF